MNTGSCHYTRAGQFIVDPEGFMINPEGLRLQGYNVDFKGNLNLFPEDLRLLTQQVDAIPTSDVKMTINFNAEDERYHSPTEPIDPTDSDSYNHMSTTRVYDALGVAHDLVIFYQRLTPGSYHGPDIAGSVRQWKAVVMEKEGEIYTQRHMSPGYTGTFYLHFNDVGHLVGNTTGQPAAGDAWTTTQSLPMGNNQISVRAGETFSFNTDPNNDPANNKTVRTYMQVDLTEWDAAGDSLNINGMVYNFTDYATGQALAAAINRNAGTTGVFANYVAGAPGPPVIPDILKVYTSGNTTASVLATNDGVGNDIVITGMTTSDLISTVTNGSGTTVTDYAISRGVITLPSASVSSAGDIVFRNPDGTVAATIPVTAGQNIGAINAALTPSLAALGLTADMYPDSSVAGAGSIYLQATATGEATNYSIEFVPATPGTNTGLTGTAQMVGGYTPDPMVIMEQSGDNSLTVKRSDSGINAILNVDPGNTMASGRFTMQKTTYALDMEVPWSTNSDETGPGRKGVRMMSFGWLQPDGSHEPQDILLDYIPSINSPTTQSAGTSDNFYIHQDGAPRGILESLDIGRDGLVSGSFSNGTVKLLGAVLLYNVPTPEKLKREGENLWSLTLSCGSEIWGRPGQGSLGKVQSGALEKSNVDLAHEMVNMINFQRAFQANSKTIQTTDQLLQELIQLKR
jgi:flagellar hook protein FlgE